MYWNFNDKGFFLIWQKQRKPSEQKINADLKNQKSGAEAEAKVPLDVFADLHMAKIAEPLKRGCPKSMGQPQLF
ncbi:MAG: hypothetical protein SOZ96_02875 [Treponema sp.]|nr:hypothetical protein [Treponema sp.]